MLAAVVRLVKARNPGRIIVGDRSARQFPDTAAVFENTGLRQAALDAGADEVLTPGDQDSDPGNWMLVQPEGYEEVWSAQGGIYAMRAIVEADHFINLPTCKNHRYALFSLSMKNLVGAISDSSRDPLHYLSSIGGNFEALSRDVVLLNRAFSPLINILDATTVLVNDGPQGDSAAAVRATPGLFMASKDRVALDAAGVALIKLEQSRNTVSSPDASQGDLRDSATWNLPQLAQAVELGLGVGSADDVSLLFEDVADATEIEGIFRG